jgi:hypothetical protein
MWHQYVASVFYAFVGINLFVALPFMVVTEANPTPNDLVKTFFITFFFAASLSALGM